jgi:RNA polymerase sigma factor (sigma-70 family)
MTCGEKDDSTARLRQGTAGMAAVAPSDAAAGTAGTLVDYERLLVEQLDLIKAIVTFIGRRNRLTASETEEFGSHVNLKLIENDYAAFRKFQGRSSLRTYLSVVIQRLFLDWRAAQWGKWRPSAFARRAGKIATLLERLTLRQGLSFEEAKTMIEALHPGAVGPAALESLYAQLPTRSCRRFVGEDALQDIPASYGDPASGLIADEQASAAAETLRALALELARLAPEDRQLLESRFLDGVSIADIARTTCQDSKKLYRRFERILAGLRDGLERQGIGRSEAAGLTGDLGAVTRGWRRLVAVRALVLATILTTGATTALAQAPVVPPLTSAAYLSASGAMTVGFAVEDRQAATSTTPGLDTILPEGSDVPAAFLPTLEQMWRASPTFRRQCARLAEGRVAVTIRLDFPQHAARTNAESVISRKGNLRADIRLRAADRRVVEYLAHEIEHVLEQMDEVDLPLAVADRMHGAHLVHPAAYETRRAVAVGRLVAHEVATHQDGR